MISYAVAKDLPVSH